MTRTDIVTKISNLIARATNAGASEEEARTCAAIACKMMVANGVAPGVTVAAESGDTSALKSELANLRSLFSAARTELADGQRRFVALDRELAAAKAEIARLRAAQPAAAPAPEAPASQPSRPAYRPRGRFSGPKVMASKYDGVCACCGRKIHAGETISYDGAAAYGHRAVHLACASQEAAAE